MSPVGGHLELGLINQSCYIRGEEEEEGGLNIENIGFCLHLQICIIPGSY